MPRPPWIISVLPKRLKPAGARLVKKYKTTQRRAERLIARWFPAPPAVPIVPIEAFLQQAHITLLELQRRQYLLEAIDAEWARLTRGQTYWIYDDAAFRALRDVDAMNIIDLCSWAIGASDTDEGLLGRVKNHYMPSLPPARRWKSDAGRLDDETFTAARERLFPKASGRALVESDADDLVEAFERRIRPLRDDRNWNRAHAHEHKGRGTTEPLDIAEARDMYRYARQVLNDLCLVALGSTWNENDVNSNNVELTAEDLLDVVFLPRWFRHDTHGRGMSRQHIYDALHADPAPGSFNDRTKLSALARRVIDARTL